MPRRHLVFAPDEAYHLYNRTIGKETIFTSRLHLSRMLDIIDFYRFPQKLKYSRFRQLPRKTRQDYYEWYQHQPPLLQIFAYAFMSNHYHLLVRQIQDKGISRFLSNVQNSFAKYYNLKYARTGGLFQNQFKAKHVETDEELLHISRYIHLNPVTSLLIKETQLSMYPWTSLPNYLDKKANTILTTDWILSHFKSGEKYLQFVLDQADYQKRLHDIRHLIVE